MSIQVINPPVTSGSIVAALGFTPAATALSSIPVGTVAAPGGAFTGATDYGFSLVSSAINVSIAGAAALLIAAGGASVNVNGSAAAPSLTVGTSGLGFYKAANLDSLGGALVGIGIGTIGAQGDGSNGVGPVTFNQYGSLLFGSLRSWFGSGNPIIAHSLDNGVGAGGMLGAFSVAQFSSRPAAEPVGLIYRSRAAAIGLGGPTAGAGATSSALQVGDAFPQLQWCGDDGAGTSPIPYNIAAQLSVLVDSAVSTGIVPAKFSFQVQQASGLGLAEAFKISSDLSFTGFGNGSVEGGLAVGNVTNTTAGTIKTQGAILSGGTLTVNNSGSTPLINVTTPAAGGASEIDITNGLTTGTNNLNIGNLFFVASSSTGVSRSYAAINGTTKSATNASESGAALHKVMQGGALTTYMTVDGNAIEVTFAKRVTTVASATGSAGLRLPAGVAPTSPVDGDMWTTTSGLFVRINGVTKTVTLT